MDLNNYQEIFSKTIIKAIKEKESPEEINWDKITDSIVKVQSELIPDISTNIYNSLVKEMPEMIERARLDEVGFEARLRDRWLKPFYLMGATIQITDEFLQSEI